MAKDLTELEEALANDIKGTNNKSTKSSKKSKKNNKEKNKKKKEEDVEETKETDEELAKDNAASLLQDYLAAQQMGSENSLGINQIEE